MMEKGKKGKREKEKGKIYGDRRGSV